MSGGIGHLVVSGPLLLAVPVAVAAGAITFLSPCCLPLVPGYLSYITGMSGAAVKGPGAAAAPEGAATEAAAVARVGGGSLLPGGRLAVPGEASGTAGPVRPAGPVPAARPVPGRGRAVAGTLLFVLGFSAVFASEGVAVGGLSVLLHDHQRGLTQVLGCVVIALGLLFAGAFDRFTFAGRIARPSIRPRAGLAGAPLLGVLFGVGWTPCIGPTLTAVLTLGLTTGTAGRAALLAFVYGLGLGIPFLVVAFAVERGMSLFGFARRHGRLITRIGGVMLIAVGALEVSGTWTAAISWLQVHWVSDYTAPL